MRNGILVVADKDSQSAISLQKYVNLNLEELKDYFSVVFVRNLGEMDREDYDFFIKQDIMPGIDYLMLLSDINGDVLTLMRGMLEIVWEAENE